MVFLVNNISEELLSPSSHQKTDNKKFFCHAGNNLWFNTMLQLRRNHKACLCRNLHLHKGIILNRLQIKLYAVTLFNHHITKQAINEAATNKLCCGSGSKLAASHHRGLNAISGHSVWEMWSLKLY